MVHDMQETDNSFSVREAAWHGLSEVLSDYPTIQEAKEIAHPWEPEEEPVYRKVITVEDGMPIERFEEVSSAKMLSRSDNFDELGVVSSTFGVVKNQEMYDIAEALESESRGNVPIKLETGGSILGGKKVWLLLRLEEPLQVKGDISQTIPYFALQNSNAANLGAFRGQGTAVRIVCNNTAQMSDHFAKRNGTEFTFRHSKNVKQRLEEAKQALLMWREGVTEYHEMMDYLNTIHVTQDQKGEFIEQFIPIPPSSLISNRVQTNVAEARAQFRSIYNTPTMEGQVQDTAYGLVQAAIEWSQHYRRTRAKDERARRENKFKRAYLDQSEFTRKATDLILDVAGA